MWLTQAPLELLPSTSPSLWCLGHWTISPPRPCNVQLTVKSVLNLATSQPTWFHDVPWCSMMFAYASSKQTETKLILGRWPAPKGPMACPCSSAGSRAWLNRNPPRPALAGALDRCCEGCRHHHLPPSGANSSFFHHITRHLETCSTMKRRWNSTEFCTTLCYKALEGTGPSPVPQGLKQSLGQRCVQEDHAGAHRAQTSPIPAGSYPAPICIALAAQNAG